MAQTPVRGRRQDSAQANTIEFRVDGLARYSGDITLGGFLYQLRNLYEALNLTDRLLSKSPKATAIYRITDLSHTSPATVEIAATPRSPDFDHTNDILDGLVGSMSQIAKDGTAPNWVDRDLLKRLRDLNGPVGRSVRAARLRRKGRTVELNQLLKAKIELILAPEETFEGSLKGRLEAINLHDQTNTFRIYPPAGASRVTCHFPEELRKAAISALDRNVMVAGVLKYKASAPFPEAIDVREIDVLPDAEELPRLVELKGAAPEATDRQTPAEFVRKLRDEWD